MEIRPVLVTNPVDDREFGAAAEHLLDEGILDLDAFRARLSVAYPDVAAHPREIAAEPTLIWYVYRDGRWVNAASRPSSPVEGRIEEIQASAKPRQRN
jgi:hypothetical protein